jgi:hypothetical protein
MRPCQATFISCMAKRLSSTLKVFKLVDSIQINAAVIHNAVANSVDVFDGTQVAKKSAGEDAFRIHFYHNIF